MRIIITGGTGLIGRALASSLADDRHEVILLSRDPSRVRSLPPGIVVRSWDGRTAAGWGTLVEGAEAIINLAGENLSEGRWTAERKLRLRASRLNAGRAVVEAIQAAHTRPRVLVQASGVGYYGPQGDGALTERAPAGSDFLARLVIDWEASTEPVEDLGVRRAIIRTGVVLSRAGGAFPRMLLPFRLFAGGHYGNGRQWFPWIHIADEVGAIRYLVECEAAGGAFNLSAPHPVTNAEFTRTLGRVMSRPAWLPVPALAFRLLFGQMAIVLLEGQRAVPAHLTEVGYRFMYPEPAGALSALLGQVSTLPARRRRASP